MAILNIITINYMNREDSAAHRKEVQEPLKIKVEHSTESVDDTAGDPIWPSMTEEGLKAREAKIDADLKANAQELVDQQLKMDPDTIGLWTKFSENMARLSQELDEARAEDASSVRMLEQEMKRTRMQMEALADRRSRLSVLNRVKGSKDISAVLETINQEKQEAMDIMTAELPKDMRLEFAGDFILSRAEQNLANELLKDPSLLKDLQTELDDLVGGQMSGEVEFTPSKKFTKKERALKDVQSKIESVQSTLADMSWLQRTFKGSEMKAQLTELQAQERTVKQAIARERVGAALKDSFPSDLPSQRFVDKALVMPSKNIETLETPWQVYQAQLASLQSLQDRRTALSRWPWKDREAKARLDEKILDQESLVEEARLEHISQGMKRSRQINANELES